MALMARRDELIDAKWRSFRRYCPTRRIGLPVWTIEGHVWRFRIDAPLAEIVARIVGRPSATIASCDREGAGLARLSHPPASVCNNMRPPKRGLKAWRLGTSRGGLASKPTLLHAEGRPVNLRLRGAQAANSKDADAFTTRWSNATSGLPTRPRTTMFFDRRQQRGRFWAKFRGRPTARGPLSSLIWHDNVAKSD